MKKLGIVFSGGGGKGAYEVGAWKALNEFGIDKNVEAVAGTSVGGLNAALFVQGDLAAAERLWRDITPAQILTVNKDNLAKNVAGLAASFIGPALVARTVLAATKLVDNQGVFNQNGLASLIEQSGAHTALINATLPLHVCALNSDSKTLEYPQLNGLYASDVKNWLLASAAIPLVFDGVDMHGTTYYDGGVLPGYSDNTPFKTLIEEHQCTHIINIYLERSPDMAVSQKAFSGVKFWNIVPTRDFDGFIAPLNFTPENAAKLLDEGYEDVKTILEQFKEFQDSEDRYIDAVFDFAGSDEYFVNAIELNKDLRTGKIADEGTLEDVTKQIASEIEAQEQIFINGQIDDLINEMQENSIELLDDAFTAITTLATADGAINAQLEQGRFGKIIGNLIGSNNTRQAEVNYGLNRAIYAQQQLIQKLNHKSMLTMEAISSLANKTNYLMNHVNVLYASIQLTEQRVNKSLMLMKSGLESLSNQLGQRIDRVENRVENLERNTLINNWYHNAISQVSSSNSYQKLINTTASFYLESGRSWDNTELSRFTNALKLLDIKDEELIPATLMWEVKNSNLLSQIESQHILPIAPGKQDHFPLLKGIQMVDEVLDNRDITSEIENNLKLNLLGSRTGNELGLELLNAFKQNDRRSPVFTSTAESLLLNNDDVMTSLQSEWLSLITELSAVNIKHLNNDAVNNDLDYLKHKIKEFKVVIPIIGKFSAGKSSLLNCYLGKNYLKTDIAPETAIATELFYGSEDRVSIHYFDNEKPTIYPLESLSDLTITDNIAFIRIQLNNNKLKNRSNITLVDMPGFDAQNINHQKAIATYLDRGDFFINLMPVDIAFDSNIIKQLEEICFDYGKEVSCLLSKVSRKTVTQVQESKLQLEKTLFDNFQKEITVGVLEVQDSVLFTIQNFEDQIDHAATQFDELLLSRYQGPFADVITALEGHLKNKISYSANTAIEIEEKIQSSKQAFENIKKKLQSSLDEFKYSLCSTGREYLADKVSTVLSANVQQLVSAAQSRTLPDTISNILRPILQIELDELIKRELAKFEEKLEMQNEVSVSGINVHLQIPQAEKEKFGIKSGAICAGIGIIILGPIGGLIAGLIGGLLGRKDDTDAHELQIEQQINNEVIPQAVSQIMDNISSHLTQTVTQLEKQIFAQLESEKESHNATLAELQQKFKDESHQFETMQSELNQSLASVLVIKNKLL